MGRLSNTEAADTRARVLASALRLFAERGRTGCTIRQIGREAGVTLGTVHHHFGTKDELYRACLEEMYAGLRALRDDVLVVVSRHDRIEDAVGDIVRASFEFGCTHHLPVRLALRTALDHGHLEEVRRESMQRPLLREATALFEAATGHPVTTLQLITQHIVSLIARAAVASDEERMMVTNAAAPEEARAAVAEELVRTAQLLLFGRMH